MEMISIVFVIQHGRRANHQLLVSILIQVVRRRPHMRVTEILVGNFVNNPERYQKLVVWAWLPFIITFVPPKNYQNNTLRV